MTATPISANPSTGATLETTFSSIPSHPGPSPGVPVDPLFRSRWSPRSFDPSPVPPELLWSTIEAARWAPSLFNEQPWYFLVATSPEDRARFASVLVPSNRAWAEKAPVLLFLLARKNSQSKGEPNPMAHFDSGSAWMSLALQATLHGLATHAMGGVDREAAHLVLGVPPEDFDILIAIALGYRGTPAALPGPLAEREHPSPRKPLSEIAHVGPFPAAPENGAR